MRLLLNVDVDNIDRAIDFYRGAFGLDLRRRLFDGSVAEMVGASSTIYLLAKPAELRQPLRCLRPAIIGAIGPRYISLSSAPPAIRRVGRNIPFLGGACAFSLYRPCLGGKGVSCRDCIGRPSDFLQYLPHSPFALCSRAAESACDSGCQRDAGLTS